MTERFAEKGQREIELARLRMRAAARKLREEHERQRPVHCPRCAEERGVAIPKECPH